MAEISKRKTTPALLCLASLVLFTGCVTRQVSVARIGPSAAYEEAMDSALTTDRPASTALIVLRRYGLEQEYREAPDKCLVALWPRALADGRRDAFYAMAELCFLRAKDLDCPAWRFGDRVRARDAYLGAALSAYLYLFSDRADPLPSAYDRRLRLACDLYNVALGKAFSDAAGRVTLRSENRHTPLGEVTLALDTPERAEALAAFDRILLADQFAVRGLGIRNRTSGLGAPVIAVKRRELNRPFQQAAGATVFLSCEESTALVSGPLKGTLRVVMAVDSQELSIGGRKVPLETDQTTPLAYALDNPLVWKLGKQVFRLGRSPMQTGIYPMEPYVPGKIPVLFVHGTMSSPFLWADMWNTLSADPEIRRRYQFWFYFYESSNPLVISAARLRESITSKIAMLDPSGKDPALQQLVIIGHSQGGLLTKMTAVDTGDALIQAFTGHPLAELGLSAEDKAKAERYAIFTPLPQVKRVVFISTPHRGSYQASGFARMLVRRLVALPADLTQFGSFLSRLQQQLALPAQFRRLPTSVDGMSPTNPVMLRLAEIPMAPGVVANSIIPIKGDDVPPAGKDGMVAYASAHLDGVESEFVVRAGHSCQRNPLVIEEVRRILLKHLAGR